MVPKPPSTSYNPPTWRNQWWRPVCTLKILLCTDNPSSYPTIYYDQLNAHYIKYYLLENYSQSLRNSTYLPYRELTANTTLLKLYTTLFSITWNLPKNIWQRHYSPKKLYTHYSRRRTKSTYQVKTFKQNYSTKTSTQWNYSQNSGVYGY